MKISLVASACMILACGSCAPTKYAPDLADSDVIIFRADAQFQPIASAIFEVSDDLDFIVQFDRTEGQAVDLCFKENWRRPVCREVRDLNDVILPPGFMDFRQVDAGVEVRLRRRDGSPLHVLYFDKKIAVGDGEIACLRQADCDAAQ